MRHLLLTFAAFCLSLLASVADDVNYQPLLQVGKVWTYDFSYVDISFVRHSGSAEWRVEGDTVIAGRRLFRMCFSNTENEGHYFRQQWCEEDGKVFICNDKGEPWELVYDFTLSAGDEAPDHSSVLFLDGLTVASTDSILVHGTLRKRLVITGTNLSGKVTWVEGIGGPLNLDEPIYRLVGDGRYYTLASCSVDGEPVFSKEDFEAPSYRPDLYTDMLAEGKTWNLCRFDNGNMHVEGIRGDTIIDGRTCKRHGYVNNEGAFHGWASLYQDGKRLYRYDENRKEFSLLFDFGLSEGDMLSLDNDGSPVRIQVTKTGQVSARGHQLGYVVFKTIEEEGVEVDYPDSYVWIEGIGGSSGPFSPIGHNWAGVSFSLHEVTCRGETLYDGLIFLGEGYEKRFLNYRPEWSYEKVAWDEGASQWVRIGDCHAERSGTDIPQPKMFEYHVITTKEGNAESKLLLREIDGMVLAKRDSYSEYVRLSCPHVGEVYEYPYDWRDDVVLYDFTLGVGDRYPCAGEVYVSEVSHMTTRDGVERRMLFLSNGLEMVEGIGCLNSPNGPFAYQNPTGAEPKQVAGAASTDAEMPTASLLSLRKFGEASEPIYVMGDEKASIHNNTMPSVTGGAIHDLTGRRLMSKPARGIYIQGGKKYIAR